MSVSIDDIHHQEASGEKPPAKIAGPSSLSQTTSHSLTSLPPAITPAVTSLLPSTTPSPSSPSVLSVKSTSTGGTKSQVASVNPTATTVIQNVTGTPNQSTQPHVTSSVVASANGVSTSSGIAVC